MVHFINLQKSNWQIFFVGYTESANVMQRTTVIRIAGGVRYFYNYLFSTFSIKSNKMRNVEIKARISDLDAICQIAEELSGGQATIIKQEDTFYCVNEGRLKMRFYGDSSATLVRYSRGDQKGPKFSDYDLLHFSVAESEKAKLLDEMLKKSVGLRGKVVKTR